MTMILFRGFESKYIYPFQVMEIITEHSFFNDPTSDRLWVEVQNACSYRVKFISSGGNSIKFELWNGTDGFRTRAIFEGKPTAMTGHPVIKEIIKLFKDANPFDLRIDEVEEVDGCLRYLKNGQWVW